MNKKILSLLALILAGLMVLSLAACAATGGESEPKFDRTADGKTDTVSVTVYAVTGVSILNPPKELLVGKTAQLSARIVPE